MASVPDPAPVPTSLVARPRLFADAQALGLAARRCRWSRRRSADSSARFVAD
jgi:hypothetical protein